MIQKLILFFAIIYSSSCFGLKPDSLYISTPEALGLKYESPTIKTTDSVNIQVWKITADSTVRTNTTIILAYGDSGNMSYWLNHAAIMSQKGFDIVLFDYRGFGKSDPFEMNPNQLYYNEFVTDLTSVIKWTKEQYPKSKTGIWALSMGTIMSTIALQNESVDFLIGEGFVLNPSDIQKKIREVKSKEIILPVGYENYQDQVKNIKVPILLFAGSQDVFTTQADSKQIAKQRKNRSLSVFNGGHLQGFQTMTKAFFGDLYITKIEQFVSKI
jgi:pimeloyl-ACP methyl ester carboxylesterase